MSEMNLRNRQAGKTTELKKELKEKCRNKRQYKKALIELENSGWVSLNKKGRVVYE